MPTASANQALDNAQPQAITPSRGENVLARIVADKRQEIARLKKTDDGVRLGDPQPSTKSLEDALRSDGPSFIMECKKASPTLGPIRPDISLEDLAAIYGPRADAISVLCDGKYFGGSFDDVKKMRDLVDVPILAKDFFVDPYQLYAARRAGADAILLMLSVLDDVEYRTLAKLAEQLNLDILTEVHSPEEMSRAKKLGARIIGINNRDLKSLTTDLGTTRRLAALAPKNAVIVSESGISCRADVISLLPHADAFLVGSALMKSHDIAAKADELLLGRVKICGLTSADDARAAQAAGATYGGLIFVAESPRVVSLGTAERIMSSAKLAYVGVFRNAPISQVVGTASALGLKAVQLHGDEDSIYRRELRAHLGPNTEIWQAIKVQDTAPAGIPRGADRLLLDTWDANVAGGTGRSFDWTLLAGLESSASGRDRIVLAGGLNPDNIVAAARTHASILDVNSGVESAPGKKDAQKINTLFKALRTMNDQSIPKQTPATNHPPGYFGTFGGTFVPEILVPALEALEQAFLECKSDPTFQIELSDLLQNFAGRSTPITRCQNLLPTGSPKLYLKREDLLHGGAHKTNQVLAQALLAKRMGKTRIIAETGAGQHGVATALACSLMGLDAVIYMGREDVRRQQPNVFRMELMGAKVIPVDAGSGTLKDAVNEALRDWTASYDTTHYLLGTAAGPHPFPTMVRDFQRIIGDEARAQMLAREGRLPDAVIACVGGGSNAIGMFTAFLDDTDVKLFGVEPAGKGLHTDAHGATLIKGSVGVLHGAKTYVLQDEFGQIKESHSISAGLDYPAVGPEHAALKDSGRADYVGITDTEALDAFQALSRSEGIIPALESAHALAFAMKLAKSDAFGADDIILVNLSGRGDKDLAHVRRHLEGEIA